ncbi:MAG: hypothetical protein LAQ30_18500 [Acidobacteriia bacterium]|nr:hypothetical protein [Terriglobia bacterium]
MKTLVALLYMAFANLLMPGQTLRPDEANAPVRDPVVDRVQRLSKRFPPERIAAANDPGTVTPMRSYCVYPDLATKSLSIEACRPSPWILRLLPPFKNVVPTTKPVPPPGDIR